jgi:hypothetical protein
LTWRSTGAISSAISGACLAPADLAVALSVADLFRLADAQAHKTLTEVSNAVTQGRPVAALHGLSSSQLDDMALGSAMKR